MEFFRSLTSRCSVAALQQELRIERLHHYCDLIDKVLYADGEHGEIYCLWGQFQVQREIIHAGVRFTLPHCPNALAWTLTLEGDELTLHCTINRAQHEADFLESIEAFLDSWVVGLEQWDCAA